MEPNPSNTLLVFRLGPYHFSVGATEVLAIMLPPPVTGIPFAPKSVAGTCLFRNRAAVIINLHSKLGLTEESSLDGRPLVFCQLSQGTTAFRVDEVVDVSRESNFSWQPVTVTSSAFFSGFLLQGEQIILHTSLQALYDMPDARPLLTTLASITPDPTENHAPTPSDTLPISANAEPAPTTPDNREEAGDNGALAPQPLASGEDLDAFDRSRIRHESHPPTHRPANRSSWRTAQEAAPANVRSRWPPRPTGWGRHFFSPSAQETSSGAPWRTWWPAGIGLFALMLLAILLLRPVIQQVPEQGPGPLFVQEVAPPPGNRPSPPRPMPPAPLQPSLARNAEVIAQPPPAQITSRPEPQEDPSSPASNDQEVYRLETEEFALIVERPSLARQSGQQGALDSGQAAPTTTQDGFGQIHVVRHGDTLWDIAARYLGDPFLYQELARSSEIKNPHIIYPGDRIRIIRKTNNR